MKKKGKSSSFCDWTGDQSPRGKSVPENATRLYKHRGAFTWKGIKTEKYKQEGGNWADIVRMILIGNHGESSKFHLRYFEIAPGGFSSLEKHRHEHVVIGLRGKGMCVAGRKKYQIAFLDTLYLKPGEPHQLRNPYKKPFGFFCIVNAKRDRPKAL
jgi:ribulose-bisphosphate carboxylase large chain